MAAADWCNQIQRDFLDHHKREAQLQPLTDVNHIITYLNGTLQLWTKQSNNTLIITDSAETPALKVEYKLCKSFPHISVMIYKVLQSICITGVKNEQHESDLLKIEDRLLQLNRLDEKCVHDHRFVIELLVSVVNAAKLSACLGQIHRLLVNHVEKTTLINENYAKQATELQLEGVHSIVLPWIKNIDLCKTKVLIAVAAGPKQDLVEGQYFHSIYREQGIIEPINNQHIIYVEMLPKQLGTIDSQCLIEVLKEKMLNQAIAGVMLGDPEAMNKDVLGRFAPNVLKRLCPHYKTPIPRSGHFDTSKNDIQQVAEEVTNTTLVNKKTYPLKKCWDARFYKPLAANENHEGQFSRANFKR